jgi:endoglucanase
VSGGPNSTAAATGDPIAAPLFQDCPAQFCYIDDIGSWSTNEITVNWNAPMSWVSSFVADQDGGVAAPTSRYDVSYDTRSSRHGWFEARLRVSSHHHGFGDRHRSRGDGDWTLTFAYTGSQRLRTGSSWDGVRVSQEGEWVTVSYDDRSHKGRHGRRGRGGWGGWGKGGDPTTVTLKGYVPLGANWEPELFRVDGLVAR